MSALVCATYSPMPCVIRSWITRPLGSSAATLDTGLVQQRVMHDDEVGMAADRLLDDDLDRVDGEQDAAHIGGRVADDEADGVAVCRPTGRVDGLDRRHDVGQGGRRHARQGSGARSGSSSITPATVGRTSGVTMRTRTMSPLRTARWLLSELVGGRSHTSSRPNVKASEHEADRGAKPDG